MAINKKRTESMKSKSTDELVEISKSGSLSSAAAEYEIQRRLKNNKKEPVDAE